MTDAMIQLGHSGLQVSPMGIGVWSWGSRFMWGYGTRYNEDDVQLAFDESIKGGVNFFDTAEAYAGGQSERLLGQLTCRSGNCPLVATKFAPYPWRLTGSSLLSALRRSLKRLGLAAVDLYQVHFPTPLVPIETWMEAMADAVQTGLTRAVGVSNYSPEQMGRAHAVLAKRGIALASNQVNYSLLHRDIERNGLIQACQDLGIGIIAYTPLASGLLTGKYTPEAPPPGLRGRRYSRNYLARIQPLIGLMREIGTAHGGKTPAQVAINWTMCKGAIPIPGAKNRRQAQENTAALGWRLAKDEVAALDAASVK